MPKRQRDYRAEYAARKQRAKDAGYTGYAEQRKHLERIGRERRESSAWAERLADRLARLGGWERFFTDDEPFFQTNAQLEAWYEALRNYYDSQTPA